MRGFAAVCTACRNGRRWHGPSRELCSIVIALLVTSAACGNRAVVAKGSTVADSVAAPTQPASDSVRGLLTLVGNEPGAVLLLSPTSRELAAVALVGSQVSLLRNVTGLEIVVYGRVTGRRDPTAMPRGGAEFDVRSFVVRVADGAPATDGVVLAAKDAFALRLADGRVVAAPWLPVALRRLVGARIWVTGGLDAVPQAYGIIRQPL